MVDMSAEAVGKRLRLMGELWELSVKLIDSKKISSNDTATEEPDITGAESENNSQNREL